MKKLLTVATLVVVLVLALALPAAPQRAVQGGLDPEEPTCTQLEGCAEEGQYVTPVAATPSPEPTADDTPAVGGQEAPPKSPVDGVVEPPALRASDAAGTPVADQDPRAGDVGYAGESTAAAIAVPSSDGDGPAGVPVLPATGGTRFSSLREPSRCCSAAYSRDRSYVGPALSREKLTGVVRPGKPPSRTNT